jgi:hypothetical protein
MINDHYNQNKITSFTAFNVGKVTKFYSVFRIRQTGENSQNNSRFSLNYIEFF